MAAMLDTNCMLELATPTCTRVGSHTWLLCKLLVRPYWASRCGQPPAASLQAVGPIVWVLWCGQPPAASLQAVGPVVLGLTGLCGQPPAALLQVVGPHVRVQLAVCSCMSTRLGRAVLNLRGCNCVGTLCICVGHACVVGWWGGLRCRAEQPQSTQARGFNAALVWRFPALYGYMPEALSAPHWYRARGR